MARRAATRSQKREEGLAYSNTWFQSGAQAAWETAPPAEPSLVEMLAGRVDTYLEIGLCEGQSMRWVLETLKPRRAVAVDLYEPPRERHRASYERHERNARANLAPWIESGQLTLVKSASQDWLRTDACHALVPDNSVQFAYVDGSHIAWDCLADLVLVLPKLVRRTGNAPGGIMAVDDLHRRWHMGRPLVRVAVQAFLAAYENRVRVVFWRGRHCAIERVR